MVLETKIDIEDMAKLAVEDNEAYAMNRKKGLGASDSSIVLGVNKWTKVNDLIAQKNTPWITEEEIAVGMKPQVRMGADLEPLILQKASEFFGEPIYKPSAQYRFVDYPYLTINYDGLMNNMPVEAKCISQFARKYWDFSKSCVDKDEFFNKPTGVYASGDLKTNIEETAKMCGIPPYYYTQCQQQMLGSPHNFCALVAMDVKEWQLHVFRIPEDEAVQKAIIEVGREVAEQCEMIDVKNS